MKRLLVLSLGVPSMIFALAGEASAQGFGRGFGSGSVSTPQGDILRGEGAYLFGAGLYNYYSAMGNSINVDTMIRLNEYIYQSIKQENLAKARHRAAVIEWHRENYEKVLDRIRNDPHEHDLTKGDALNAKLEQLLDPKIQPSMFGLSPVPLDGETVRSIPFFFGSEGTVISMTRVSPGKNRPWPVGLRGDAFDHERDAYDLALENTRELQNQSTLSRDAIEALGKAIAGLQQRLDQIVTPNRNRDYVEAEQFLKRLEDWKNQLRKQDVERIVGEIEKYHGTTVHDLVVFMQRNKLRFSVPKIGDETELYPKLFAKFEHQLETVKNARPGDQN